MSLVVAIDELQPDQVKRPGRRPGTAHTDFFKASSDKPDAPSVYLVEQIPGRVSSAHYHENDEFQIIVGGKGKFGRHDLSAYCVHFARAYTPYGPLLPDTETGWAFMTMRTHYDRGSLSLATSLEKLKQIPNRRPWQITKKVDLPVPGAAGVSLQDVAGIKDDQGLFALTLAMAPHTQTTAPDPSGGDGQFVLVVKGGLVYDNREHKAMAVVFVKPEEEAFHIHAGAQGLQGFIFNFPQVKPRAVDTNTPSTAAGFKKWQCALCSFSYDEAQGIPEEGIFAGTRWDDVPTTWSCPDCSASKSDFQMVEV